MPSIIFTEVLVPLAWPIVTLVVVLIFKAEFKLFLANLGEIKTKWFELRRLKEETETLREALKISCEAWIHFLRASVAKDAITNKEANEAFRATVNNMAAIAFTDVDERMKWFKELGIQIVDANKK